MFKKMTLRVKLTLMTMFILSMCCVGLTMITNLSAKEMSVRMAITTTPAMTTDMTGVSEMPDAILLEDVAMEETSSVLTDEQQSILNRYYLTSIGYMVLIILLGGLAAYYLSGKAIASITRLNEGIKKSSISTLSNPVVVPTSHDEVAELANSFNDMQKKLNDSFTFQKQFSANVAHELRTPLTVLNTKLEVYRRKHQQLDEETNGLVADLSKQVSRLIDMVEKFLQLTNDDVLGEYSEITSSDLFDSILTELHEDIAQKNITVTVLNLSETVLVGELDLLYRAFYNLIENSIKYNAQDGQIEISGTMSETETVIQITDTGIGIPKEHYEDVLKSLYRVDDARSREIGGSGLGLAIVKQIIEQHQGKIKFGPNKNNQGGTTVTIQLPFSKEA